MTFVRLFIKYETGSFHLSFFQLKQFYLDINLFIHVTGKYLLGIG